MTLLRILSWREDRDRARPPGPRGWGDEMGRVAGVLGLSVAWGPGPVGHGAALAWQPDMAALRTALASRRLCYLCWGFTRHGESGWRQWLRRLRLGVILRRARLVMVNDPLTQTAIAEAFGVRARLVPFPVDLAWFGDGPAGPPRPEVIVPGSNDRDEALAAAIACAGQPVIRVTQAPGVAAWHAAHPAPGLTLRKDIAFDELRALYRTCRVVALPLRETGHAAGQTVALEALATGAPLVVSEGMTASIVGGYPGVTVMPLDADAAAWRAAIEAARPPEPGGPILDHDPDTVAARIAAEIRAALGGDLPRV